MAFESIHRTHVGCRRKLNEDAVLAQPHRGIWAVADGMGGHDAGEVASAMVVEALARIASPPDLMATVRNARIALDETNARLVALGRSAPSPRTIGTTVAVLVMDEASFACVWAGDSRAYHARNGALQRLTRDHSLVQQLVDAGELHPDGAAAHPNANVITRAVGADTILTPDLVHGDVRAGDVFMLATDGLTRLVAESEILEVLTAADLGAAADALLETAIARGAPDNVTFVIARPL